MLVEDRKPNTTVENRLVGAGSVFGDSTTLVDDTIVLFDDATALFGGSDRTNTGYLPSNLFVEDRKPKSYKIIDR